MSSHKALEAKFIDLSNCKALSDDDVIISGPFITEGTGDLPLVSIAFAISRDLQDPSFYLQESSATPFLLIEMVEWQ